VRVKFQLKAKMPEAEYDRWVRPIYLMRLARDCLMLVVPPSREIMEKAKSSMLFQELIRFEGYSGAFFLPILATTS
jgi:hypothetical protein